MSSPYIKKASSISPDIFKASRLMNINAPEITSVPTIIEAKRINPTSIFLSWGPYAGIDKFNVRYGVENGKWLYNTNVKGFSTTINALPPNRPIWVRIAVRNTGLIGTYGESKLVGGPSLPNTGFDPGRDFSKK